MSKNKDNGLMQPFAYLDSVNSLKSTLKSTKIKQLLFVGEHFQNVDELVALVGSLPTVSSVGLCGCVKQTEDSLVKWKPVLQKPGFLELLISDVTWDAAAVSTQPLEQELRKKIRYCTEVSADMKEREEPIVQLRLSLGDSLPRAAGMILYTFEGKSKKKDPIRETLWRFFTNNASTEKKLSNSISAPVCTNETISAIIDEAAARAHVEMGRSDKATIAKLCFPLPIEPEEPIDFRDIYYQIFQDAFEEDPAFVLVGDKQAYISHFNSLFQDRTLPSDLHNLLQKIQPQTLETIAWTTRLKVLQFLLCDPSKRDELIDVLSKFISRLGLCVKTT